MRYRDDIDGLRAIAVSSVVLFHAGIPGFSGGFVGVDIFFVISGYLITRIIKDSIEKGHFSLIDFYDRRIRRIFPALFTVYLAVFAVGFVALFPGEFKLLAKSLLGSAVFGANIHFYGQSGYFDAPSITKPLLHTWSLSVEEQFYVIWPLAMLGLARFVQPRFLVPLMLTGFALSLAYAEIEIVRNNAEAAFYMPHARAWELISGAMLAIILPRIVIGRGLRETMAGAGLLLIACSIVLLSKNQDFPGVNALFPCIGAALIIAAGTQSATQAGRILSVRPLVFIGLISYSLYLWHWPVFSFWHLLMWRAPEIGESVALIAASILLATATWRYIETPFRRRRPEQASKAKFTIRAGLATASVFAICGYAVALSEGLPGRFNADISEIYEIAKTTNFSGTCFYEGANAKVEPKCLLGRKVEKGPYDVVLVGDSHAHHFSAAIDSVLEDKGLSGRLVTRGNCFSLPGVKESGNGGHGEQRSCAEFVDGVNEFFTADTKTKLIIIAQRWENYSQSKQRHLADDIDPRSVDLDTTRRVLERALRRNIEMLSTNGKKVLLVGQVPPHPAPPVYCAARGLYSGNDVSMCSISRIAVNKNIGYSSGLLRKLASKHSTVDTFIPADILCRDGACPVLLDGVFLYKDDDHINDAGSREFAKYIAKSPFFSEVSRLQISAASNRGM